MTCAACGAPAPKDKKSCPICGLSQQEAESESWSRSVEAVAYEDLQNLLDEDEALLGITRGRLVGSWRPRAGLNPRAFFTPFANLGLTGTRLILQPISQGDGRALTGAAASYPLSIVIAMTRSDADPLVPGRTVRLVIHLATKESMRIKITGRMTDSAAGIVEVWQSLYRDQAGTEPLAEAPCPHCGRELDRPYRFCPFCGKEQEDEE